MNKSTDELLSEIIDDNSIQEYLSSNHSEIHSDLFIRFVEQAMAEKGINRQKLIRNSLLNTSYIYDILNGKKVPSRDTVIKVAFALELTVDAANRLLHLAGYGNLYPRVERDAVIIFCLGKGKSLNDANDLLFDINQKLIVDKQ